MNTTRVVTVIVAVLYVLFWFAYDTVGVKPVKEYIEKSIDVVELADRVVVEPLAGLCPIDVTKDIAISMLEEIFK